MKQGRSFVASVAVLGVVMLASLVMMSAATNNSTRFAYLFSVLFVVQCLGLVLFLTLIVVNLRGLIVKLRRGDPGSRLTLRMMAIFVTLAVAPAIAIYSFSLDFLRRGVDSWFDVEIENALDNALELSKYALELRMREHLSALEQASAQLTQGGGPTAPLDLSLLRSPDATVVSNSWDFGAPELDSMREQLGAEELVLLSKEGRLLASSSSVNDFAPVSPPGSLLLQVSQGRSYIALEPSKERGLTIQAGVAVRDPTLAERDRILYALFPVSKRPNELASNIQAAFSKYDKLVFLREKLKLSFTLVLTMVLLFSITAAVLAAFYSARRLAAPIHRLARGTRAVADGDYNIRIENDSRDDFGVLVDSFNEMTAKLERSQAQARASREALEKQHAYLSTVLGNLSSGVVTLTFDGVLRTCNTASGQILGIELGEFVNHHLDAVKSRHAFLEPFVEEALTEIEAGTPEWQKEIVFFGREGRQHVMCRGVELPGEDEGRDYVVVFDDLTALVKGQRDAAWSEVARRLAHEIKNPLTPIQLSAERLRHKYLEKVDPEGRDAFDRLTGTIVTQVDSMKRMVNTFSDYARPPQPEFEDVDLNALIESVLDLYRSGEPEPVLERRLDPALPRVHADPGRLRQVLNNLVKNAIEAHGPGAVPTLVIHSRELVDDHMHYVELSITDSGSGLSNDPRKDIFEPYVTHKDKGTGLGLAIVKKIVEEHGGGVWLANNADAPGATATIRLPVRAQGAAPVTDDANQLTKTAL